MQQTLADIIVLDLLTPVTAFGSLVALAFMFWHWQNELMKDIRLRRTVKIANINRKDV